MYCQGVLLAEGNLERQASVTTIFTHVPLGGSISSSDPLSGHRGGSGARLGIISMPWSSSAPPTGGDWGAETDLTQDLPDADMAHFLTNGGLSNIGEEPDQYVSSNHVAEPQLQDFDIGNGSLSQFGGLTEYGATANRKSPSAELNEGRVKRESRSRSEGRGVKFIAGGVEEEGRGVEEREVKAFEVLNEEEDDLRSKDNMADPRKRSSSSTKVQAAFAGKKTFLSSLILRVRMIRMHSPSFLSFGI